MDNVVAVDMFQDRQLYDIPQWKTTMVLNKNDAPSESQCLRFPGSKISAQIYRYRLRDSFQEGQSPNIRNVQGGHIRTPLE